MSLVSKKSITYLTSGIVIELSAMFVATIIFLFPSLEGLKILSCSSSVNDE